MRLLRLLPAVAALVAALLLASCGSGGDSTTATSSGPDPATVVPAGSVAYLDATVRPQGDQAESVNSALGKLLGSSDVGPKITGLLDNELQKEHMSYAQDVEPWLGDKVGVFVPSLAGVTATSNPDAALVVATTDTNAAGDAVRELIERDPHGGPVKDASYKGVDYFTQDKDAYAFVGDFLVAGTDQAVKDSIDTSSATSLAASDQFTSALSAAPDDRLGTAYVDTKDLVDAIVKSSSLDANGAGFAHLLQQAPLEPIVAWADATPSSIGLEVSAPAPKDAPTGAESLISGFPADSWFAFGVHGFGQGLAQGLDSLSSLSPSALGGASPAGALQRVKRLTGLDLPSFAKWLTDVSGFVSGSSIFSLGGAVVLSSRDDGAAADTLDEIERILRNDVDLQVSPLGGGATGFKVVPQGAPIEIDVEQRDGKVVVGLGAGSVDKALSPDSTLADSSSFKSASDALGSGLTPTFFLDFAPIGGFLSLPGASSDPQIEQAKPYLDRLDYLVAGSGVSDGRVLSRLVLGVKDGSGSASDVTAAIAAP